MTKKPNQPHPPLIKPCEDCGAPFKPVTVPQNKCVECLRKANRAVRDVMEAMRQEAETMEIALRELRPEGGEEAEIK